MTSTHSPLPPPMPATLETIGARLDHAITVLELTADRVQRLEDGRMQAEQVEASMRKIALRLSASALALSASRAVGTLRAASLMVAGGFLGGFTGELVWRVLGPHIGV
jgi:hypothetical protein